MDSSLGLLWIHWMDGFVDSIWSGLIHFIRIALDSVDVGSSNSLTHWFDFWICQSGLPISAHVFDSDAGAALDSHVFGRPRRRATNSPDRWVDFCGSLDRAPRNRTCFVPHPARTLPHLTLFPTSFLADFAHLAHLAHLASLRSARSLDR